MSNSPAYKYRCKCGTKLLSYRGVHSCLPACEDCGETLHCVKECPVASGCCGYAIYINKQGKPYCPWCRKESKI